jgi:hypothetical protein
MTIQEAFDAMIKGKSFRVTKEFRDDVNERNGGKLSDQWFTIISIACDERITICGNNHTIFEGENINILKP